MTNYSTLKILMVATLLAVYSAKGICQKSELYPPFTKWYQDPMGLRPLELSTAFGFAWGSAAVAACFLLTKNDSSFHRKVTVYSEEGYSFGYKSPYTAVLQNELGFMYKVRKWMAVGAGFNILHFTDKINNTWSIAVSPFARWYPVSSKTVRLFFQYGAGASYSMQIFPLAGTGWEADTARTGTKFNVMSKYGCGAEIKLTKRLSLETSVRHFHLSNGNIKGIQRNPSHDSNGFFAGIMYTVE